jgi:hypothetical protein
MIAAGRLVYRAWCATCLATLLVLIGVRWLAYTSWYPQLGLGPFVRETMVIDQQVFLWPAVYLLAKKRVVGIAALVLVVGLHRHLPRHLVRHTGGRWRLRPLVVALVLGALVGVQYLADVNPTVAVGCAASLAALWLAEHARLADLLPGWAGMSAALAATSGVVVLGGDAADAAALSVWMVVLLVTHRVLAPRIGAVELALLRVVAVLPLNLLPTAVPAVLPLHGGTFLGSGLAYSFCERADRGVLYAAVPVCGSMRTSYADCRDGAIVEYDLRSLRRTAEHRFFSTDFYGRLEQLVCLDDEVQVAVQGVFYRGRDVIQGVLSFPVAAPEKFSVLTAERGIGTTIAYDAAHDALFYSGEFDNPLVRYDRRTHAFDETPGLDLARRWYEPIALEANNGSLAVQTDSVHPGRNRIYLADWMQGRWAYAVDLDTLRVVQRYEVGGGGAMGVTVDPERDRLFVSSMWGLEVVDLATDTVVARIRTGLGNRPVIVDRTRNRLYLASTLEGKLRILDRDTLAVVGKIPLGFGARYLHLSNDGTRLFASSVSSQYYWDPDTLGPSRR